MPTAAHVSENLEPPLDSLVGGTQHTVEVG